MQLVWPNFTLPHLPLLVINTFPRDSLITDAMLGLLFGSDIWRVFYKYCCPQFAWPNCTLPHLPLLVINTFPRDCLITDSRSGCCLRLISEESLISTVVSSWCDPTAPSPTNPYLSLTLSLMTPLLQIEHQVYYLRLIYEVLISTAVPSWCDLI